jgi:3-oxoacyl-[acyl-carrier-protein] synthase-3
MAYELIATGMAVPPRRLTNDDLAKIMDTNDEWIRSHSGIGARHLVEEGVACSDLAEEAARSALTLAIERGRCAEKTVEELALTLDVIIVASVTGDYIGCPSVSCLLQSRLGAKRAAAMDILAGCTGFIYGVETAAGLLAINEKRRRALVIGADLLSRVTNWADRSTCVLFGDGAGAVLLEKTDSAEPSGLLRTILAADGSGAEHLMIRRGGSRNPFKHGEVIDVPPHLEMSGRAVYNFAVKAMTSTIEQLLADEQITIADVKRIVPHQANARIVQAAAKRLGIPEEKFFLNIHEYANTSSASIPIAVDELNRAGELRKGDLLMTIGFGGGLTYGGTLIRI